MSDDRLIAVNFALQLFAPGTFVNARRGGGYTVAWTDWRGKRHERRYSTLPKLDCWPRFHEEWGHGGAYSQSLGMLMRWLQGKSVWPLSGWARLAIKNNVAIADILEAAGWPTEVKCVKCGQPLAGRFDWYSSDKISGPGHFWNECPTTKGES